VLLRTREKLEHLQAVVAELEARHSAVGATGDAPAASSPPTH
jgi:BMFP domain-containing protein YqiC